MPTEKLICLTHMHAHTEDSFPDIREAVLRKLGMTVYMRGVQVIFTIFFWQIVWSLVFRALKNINNIIKILTCEVAGLLCEKIDGDISKLGVGRGLDDEKFRYGAVFTCTQCYFEVHSFFIVFYCESWEFKSCSCFWTWILQHKRSQPPVSDQFFFHTFPKCTARRVCLRVCVCESVNQEGLTEDF